MNVNWKVFEQYAILQHSIRNRNHIVWNWINIPEEHLVNSGYINNINMTRMNKIKQLYTQKRQRHINSFNEYGFDGLALDTSTKTYHSIQAKFYNRKITSKIIATAFSAHTCRLYTRNNQSKLYLYHSSSLEINLLEDIKNSGNFVVPIKLTLPSQ